MRDAPHGMQRLTLLILLQDEHTWPLIIRRIIFDHDGFACPRENVLDKKVICREFIIAMV